MTVFVRSMCALLLGSLVACSGGDQTGTPPTEMMVLNGAGGSGGAAGTSVVSEQAGETSQAGMAAGGVAPINAGAGGGGGMTEPTEVPPVWETWSQTPFVMDTWFWQRGDIAVADRVAMVKNLGYPSIALSVGQQEAEYVAAMQGQLDVIGIYAPVAIDSYPNGVVELLTGTGGWVWLALTSSHGVSDPAGDAQALDLINTLADDCKQAGLPGIALYPHVGFWMEKVTDAVRLAEQANRDEVRVVFNQYHWMVAQGGQDLKQLLADALPYLQVVTLNGSGASPSILPLNEGEYDVSPILQELVDLEYAGSVGFQGYSIDGDVQAKLQASMTKWDELLTGLEAN